MLGAVGRVREGLVAAGELAHVGLLPRVGSEVDLEVLQSGEGLVAPCKLQSQGKARQGEVR